MADAGHEGFLRHRGFRWLKLALAASFIALLGYIFADVGPHPNGGTWYGYTLGTIGALLIVWLALLGIRKRAMTRGKWSLKAWTSAHVYLGLALIVIATLHTGFQFGWNVHTLAYALMVLVIASGIFGIVAYATLPATLSNNREQMTQTQMVEALRATDRQLLDAAQPLPQHAADRVRIALAQDAFGGSLLRRLSGNYPACATQRAIEQFNTEDPAVAADPAVIRVEALLNRRKALLERMRRHLRLKGLLEVWLFVHVPATFALLAALTAHVVSVFYYW
ncbi:MAG TPA: hypothetical protein VHG29_13955 [Novosphingobium sp.]|nr:hypothetical protein [Novosphingobium sp.]